MLLLFNNLLLPRGLSDAQEYIVEASAIIKDAVTKYPEGSLFHVMASHCARKQCKVDEGIKVLLLLSSMLNYLDDGDSIGKLQRIETTAFDLSI